MLTIAFFGASGSGKSTVINHLLGEDAAEVGVHRAGTHHVARYSSQEYPRLLDWFGFPLELIDTPSGDFREEDRRVQDEIALRGSFHVHVVCVTAGDQGALWPLLELLDNNPSAGKRLVFVTGLMRIAGTRTLQEAPYYQGLTNVPRTRLFFFEPHADRWLAPESMVEFAKEEHQKAIRTLERETFDMPVMVLLTATQVPRISTRAPVRRLNADLLRMVADMLH